MKGQHAAHAVKNAVGSGLSEERPDGGQADGDHGEAALENGEVDDLSVDHWRTR